MKKKYILLVWILILNLVLNTSMVAFAANSDNENNPTDMSEISPYEYGVEPTGVLVFIYRGYAPFLEYEINTSNCVEGRLYVYNIVSNSVVEISTENVTEFTATQDNLFFATTSQSIYKSDYAGNSAIEVYQSEAGVVKDMGTYLGTLFFIEDWSKVVLLDTESGESRTVIEHADLDWIIMLSESTILVATLAGEYFTYDYVSGNTVTDLDNVDVNNLINQAVSSKETNNPNSRATTETTVTYSSNDLTQTNDISFPLKEYNADIYTSAQYQNFNHPVPISWFHENGKEGCSSSNCSEYSETHECEGFARYAHDAYLHILDEDIGYDYWKSSKHPVNTDRDLAGSQTTVKNFFNSMKTGAYIRYGKDEDNTSPEGVHSIVFVCAVDNGIWVYECNQSYYDNLSTTQQDAHSESYYGCGVHFQYYTYARIAANYDYIAHYINHAFTDTPVYYNSTYHNVGCEDCDGYLRQEHVAETTYAKDDTYHWYSCESCTAQMSKAAHTPGSTYKYNGTQHWKTCTVCGGGKIFAADHIPVLDATTGSYKCKTCGCKNLTDSMKKIPVFPIAES